MQLLIRTNITMFILHDSITSHSLTDANICGFIRGDEVTSFVAVAERLCTAPQMHDTAGSRRG